MKRKTNIKLELTDSERVNLRKNKIKISELADHAPEEIAVLLNIPEERAKELYALADFQRIPSIGIEFAKDLLFLGYYCIEQLSGKSGSELLDQFEKKKEFRTDPCVEDQFRLAVYFAINEDYSKTWWDFTSDRKKYREKFGYPNDRPEKIWSQA